MSKFECKKCGYVARDNYNLNRHERSHLKLQCKLCDETFVSEMEEKCHKYVCAKLLICFYCNRKMSTKSNLTKHIKRSHTTSDGSTRPRRSDGKMLCPLCSLRFRLRDEVESHLMSDHHKSLEKQFFVFDSENDFNNWKADLENGTKCAFTRTRGVDVGLKTKRLAFYCFRSGLDRTKPMESRKRLLRTLGSNKINAYCPARILVTVRDTGKVEVTCVLTHVGHDFEIARLPFPKSYRKSLAMKIKSKIPLDEILSTELEGASTEPITRCHFLKRKDLINIARDFGIQSDVIPHKNNAVGVRALKNEKVNAQSSIDKCISSHEEKMSEKVQAIRRRHKIYLKERNLMEVILVNCDEWLVSSLTLSDLHTVSAKQKSCERCSLSCGWCKACIHMYTCTCVDNAIKGNMCKHIHKVSSEYNAEFSCEPDPSTQVERPLINFDSFLPSSSDDSDFGEETEISFFSDIPPPSVNQTRKDELYFEFQEVLDKIENEEQYVAVKKGIASLDATVSALKRKMEAESRKPQPSPAKIGPNKAISPQKQFERQQKTGSKYETQHRP